MRSISTVAAPSPVAAYSQAVETDGLVFTAGQVGIDPGTGKLVDGLEAQGEQVFENLRHILAAAHLTVANVVKVSIFMTDLKQFAAVNQIYERFVGSARPARTTAAVSALPLGALIEVDVIAARN